MKVLVVVLGLLCYEELFFFLPLYLNFITICIFFNIILGIQYRLKQYYVSLLNFWQKHYFGSLTLTFVLY